MGAPSSIDSVTKFSGKPNVAKKKALKMEESRAHLGKENPMLGTTALQNTGNSRAVPAACCPPHPGDVVGYYSSFNLINII